MSSSNLSSNSYRHDDITNDNQTFQSVDPNSSASFDISRLDIQAPVNIFAKRIKSIFDQIQQFRTNFENAKSTSENEERCVKFCEDLLQEHIKSLDQLNVCLTETANLSDKLEEANYKIKDLERSLWYEKETKTDLKKKFEDDEQQNQEENSKKEKLINALQAKLKKIENERKQINEEKQDLLVHYQTDLAKFEKERLQLRMANKKLMNDKELDELQSLNHKNALVNMTHELCNLFNLASTYRRKNAFFGKQFLNTFDLIFGRFKFNGSNVTFLEMPSISDETFNASVLNLKDITCEELSNFNIVLKEKLIQNEDELTIEEETFISNLSDSKLVLSDNFANNFEDRLLGNETFKLANLTEGKQHIPATFIDIIAKDLLDELITEETKLLIIKALLESNKSNSTIQNSTCKEQIRYMFKPDRTVFEESFQEEIYNRFEESFTENLAKTCGANGTNNEQELLLNILNNGSNVDHNKEEFSRNYSQQIDSKIRSARFNDSDHKVRKIASQTAVRKYPNDRSTIVNSTTTTEHENDYEYGERQHNSEIQSMVKSKQWFNSNVTITNTSSTSRSSSTSSCETNTTTELIVTLNKDFRSDGESIVESPNDTSTTNSCSNDSDVHSIQLTSVNNLSNVFNELSSNQKLNSTVKSDERCYSSGIKLNSLKRETNGNLNSTMSSDMRLSDDDSKDPDDNLKEDDESDPLLIDAMMSKDQPASYNLVDFYSTIKHDSDHRIMNMELTNSTAKSSRNQSSLSSLIDKHDDENVLRKSDCSLHSSNSKCRFRKR